MADFGPRAHKSGETVVCEKIFVSGSSVAVFSWRVAKGVFDEHEYSWIGKLAAVTEYVLLPECHKQTTWKKIALPPVFVQNPFVFRQTVGVAQLVEHRIVAPDVVGSIPIAHPIVMIFMP